MPVQKHPKGRVAEYEEKEAPKIAKSTRAHAAKEGPETLSKKVAELDTKEETKHRRKEAIGKKRIPGKAIDETPPALFRKPGDPVTTTPTSFHESNYQGGVFGAAVQQARDMGPEAEVSIGIQGEALPGQEVQNDEPPFAAAKRRHAEKRNRNVGA